MDWGICKPFLRLSPLGRFQSGEARPRCRSCGTADIPWHLINAATLPDGQITQNLSSVP
jgi:hypothetical protein